MIEKPWEVYTDLFPIGIGVVVGEEGRSVDILYAEGQQYLAETWRSKNIKRFETYKQAIDYFVEKTNDSKDRLENVILRDFPKTVKRTSLKPALETRFTPRDPHYPAMRSG
jgi:hypothetical protein